MSLNYESLASAINRAVRERKDFIEIVLGTKEYKIDIDLAQRWLIDLL